MACLPECQLTCRSGTPAGTGRSARVPPPAVPAAKDMIAAPTAAMSADGQYEHSSASMRPRLRHAFKVPAVSFFFQPMVLPCHVQAMRTWLWMSQRRLQQKFGQQVRKPTSPYCHSGYTAFGLSWLPRPFPVPCSGPGPGGRHRVAACTARDPDAESTK